MSIALQPAVGVSADNTRYRPTVPGGPPRPAALVLRFLDQLWMLIDNSPVDRQAP